MLVATDTGLDNNSSTDGSTDSFTDDRDTKLQVLENPTVCKSVCIQRNA
jgi:hypothetical protein